MGGCLACPTTNVSFISLTTMTSCPSLLPPHQMRTSTASDIARGVLPTTTRHPLITSSSSNANEPTGYTKVEGDLSLTLKDLSRHTASKVYHNIGDNGSIAIIFRLHDPVPRTTIGDFLLTIMAAPDGLVTDYEKNLALKELTNAVNSKEDKVAFRVKLDCIVQGVIQEVMPLFPTKDHHTTICRLFIGFLRVPGADRSHTVMRLVLQNYLLANGLITSLDTYLDQGYVMQLPTYELLGDVFAANRPALLKAINQSSRLLEKVQAEYHDNGNVDAKRVMDVFTSGKEIPPQVMDVYKKVKLEAYVPLPPGMVIAYNAWVVKTTRIISQSGRIGY